MSLIEFPLFHRINLDWKRLFGANSIHQSENARRATFEMEYFFLRYRHVMRVHGKSFRRMQFVESDNLP